MTEDPTLVAGPITSGGTFRSLRTHNFRLWFVGQTTSQVGFWVQTVAQALLVLELTSSGAALGIVTALQYLAVVVVGPWAGVALDRIDKRHVLVATQTTTMV